MTHPVSIARDVEGCDPFVVVGPARTIVEANAAAASLFQWPMDELLGAPLDRLLPERARAAHAVWLTRFFAEPGLRTMHHGLSLVGLRRDGHEVPIDVSLVPVSTPEGLRLLASVRDRSERAARVAATTRADASLRALFERSPEAMLVADDGGRLVDANRAACELLARPRATLLTLTLADLVVEAERARLRAMAAVLASPGSVSQADWTLVRGDGRTLEVEVRACILDDGRRVASVREVGARKQAEAALQASEASLRRSQEIAGVGTWEWDLERDEVTSSAVLHRIFGRPPEPRVAPRRAWAGCIPASERVRVKALIASAIAERRGFSFEHRLDSVGGDERWVRQQGEVVVEEGRVVRVLGTVLDISDLRAVERERARALRELTAVLDQCPVGITMMRVGDDVAVVHNRVARQLTTDEGTLGPGAAGLTDTDGRPVCGPGLPILRALRGETIAHAEYVLRGPDGGALPVEIAAGPIRAEDGSIEGAVVAFQDLTAAKEIERLRAEWNAVVAHDLRQPLNAMRLNLELLLRESRAWSEAARRRLGVLGAMIGRLSRMTGDLLDLSRLDAHRLTLDRRPLELAACVRATVEQIAAGAVDRRFIVDVREPIPVVLADGDRVSQVIENLLTNAVKYGEAETEIRIEVSTGDGVVEVAVTNHGEPIPAADLARVFERFQRAGVASHRAVPGIGLGLQIAQALVEAHGGHITVDSGPGRPTTFRFTLPIEGATEPTPAPEG